MHELTRLHLTTPEGHLDRIDHTRGYEVGNLQIITCAENVVKGNKERRKGYVHIPEVEDDNCPF
jgi:hypothetical protein